MQAIINGEMYEIEPAVKVILDRLMCENAELKRENKRLEEAFQKATVVIAATDCAECKKDAVPVKHGRWEYDKKRGQHFCSECRQYTIIDRLDDELVTDYCPDCGARMDGGAEND